MTCSHSRSIELFAASVNSNCLIANKCSSYCKLYFYHSNLVSLLRINIFYIL